MIKEKLDGPHYPDNIEGPYDSLVIFLHGYGSDGEDLISLAPAFHQHLPNTFFIAPNAPYRCDQSVNGYQWFGLQLLDPFILLPAARHTSEYIEDFISHQAKRLNLPHSRIALIGFSQGTMMGLHVAFRQRQQLGALIGFSGAMIAKHLLKQEIISYPPTLLLHGEQDMVIPCQESKNAAKTLEDAKVPVQFMNRPNLGHSIDPEGLKAAIQFLKEIFIGKDKPKIKIS